MASTSSTAGKRAARTTTESIPPPTTQHQRPQHLTRRFLRSHSSAPRLAHALPRVHAGLDVAAHDDHLPPAASAAPLILAPSPSPPPSPATPSPAVKVDSQSRTLVSTVKSRAHSRLASFGRIRSRGSVLQSSVEPAESLPPETLPVPDLPVSPLLANTSQRSDASTPSANSSETTLSEDFKSLDTKSIHDRPYSNEKLPNSALTTSDNTEGEGFSPFSQHPREQYQDLAHLAHRMMHQTSSRLLRMTEEERPFTRDFKDLFSTLMVSLPLTPHRPGVRFSRVEHTFTTDEAMTNLGSLKFSQSNRMPDPKDPSRIVTTTTTTTFSMAKEMARSVCQRFFDSRFIESVEGKTDFTSRGSVWQLTPKGMHILARFCQRNGIHQRHVNDLLDSPRNMMQLVILEREVDTDKINMDSATISVIFRRFAGDTGPNLKAHTSSSDSDSIHEYATGLIGVRMQRSRRGDKDAPYAFSGKSAYDWLMNCCTIVDKREVVEIAQLFIAHGLVELVDDKHSSGSGSNGSQQTRFNPSKHVMYAVTQKGMRTAGWITAPNGVVNGDATTQQRVPNGVSRDSNTNRMTVIIRDPALRLLFREYLRETHCEENLAFYVEVRAFLSDYDAAKAGSAPPRLDVIRETLASAYSLYNAFLAPGSPCELNIDHNLRNALAGRMTRAVGEDDQMVRSLDEVASLFDQAQSSVFKLMASDSVPKFSREPKYANVLRDRNLEGMMNSLTVG